MGLLIGETRERSRALKTTIPSVLSVVRKHTSGLTLRNAIAIAEAGREGEIRYLGEVDASPESMLRLVGKLASKYEQLHFCYGLDRLGMACESDKPIRHRLQNPVILRLDATLEFSPD